MANITRIKKFIRRQRYIGENQFGDKMRKRYDKTAKEFYSRFADQVYYEKDGEKIGLDIQTLWYFRTNDMIKDERGHTVDLKSGNCNLADVTHRCILKPYGDEEMKCLACGYMTFRNDTKTTQEIIEQMVKDGYETPDCSNGG